MQYCISCHVVDVVKFATIGAGVVLIGVDMRIVGFPIDTSLLQDTRIVRALRARQALVQATLDLIQAGDVEPTAAAITIIAGLPCRDLFRHFTSLADLYAAAFDLAVSRAFDRNCPVDAEAPLPSRVELLLSDRAQL